MAIKIVDDILMEGNDDDMRCFISKFNDTFELGEIVKGPCDLRYYGMNVIQDADFTVPIHADKKLQAIEPYSISRIRRRKCDERVNDVELKYFMSINASTSSTSRRIYLPSKVGLGSQHLRFALFIQATFINSWDDNFCH